MRDLLRILILGNKGQLGTELHRSFPECTTFGYDRDEIDVADNASVRSLIKEVRPDVILNASAYTAVDRAESEPEIAMAINGQAPGFLAEEAQRTSALFVHYSTDYVFDGTKPGSWTEEDEPNPLNVYGRTKLAGERAVQRVGGKYLIFRTSWVYSPHGNNFMLTMLRLGRERTELKVVGDQIGAPTTARALAVAAAAIVEKLNSGDVGNESRWAGLYHMTCMGQTSWCGFARAILTRAFGEEWNEKVKGIATSDYPTPARRPMNSVLSNAKLQQRFGLSLPAWDSALDLELRETQVRRSASV